MEDLFKQLPLGTLGVLSMPYVSQQDIFMHKAKVCMSLLQCRYFILCYKKLGWELGGLASFFNAFHA